MTEAPQPPPLRKIDAGEVWTGRVGPVPSDCPKVVSFTDGGDDGCIVLLSDGTMWKNRWMCRKDGGKLVWDEIRLPDVCYEQEVSDEGQ